jgi:hypothetical protein
MVTPRQYATANAFRTALETRLLQRSRRDESDLQRLRRQVAFDRLLARMFGQSHQMRDGWILKGGYALELRFRHARAIERETLAADRVLASVDATFGRRRTHEIPRELPVPPAEWERPFIEMAEECQLRHTPASARAEVSQFWTGLQRLERVRP